MGSPRRRRRNGRCAPAHTQYTLRLVQRPRLLAPPEARGILERGTSVFGQEFVPAEADRARQSLDALFGDGDGPAGDADAALSEAEKLFRS